MRNVSIRFKILAGVVLVNLIGALVVVVYLHQTYSGGLDVTAQEHTVVSVGAYDQIQDIGGDELGSITGTGAVEYAERLKAVTGADYGVLLYKDAIDQAAFEAQREAAGLPSNWEERETYVLSAVTDEALGEKMQLTADPASIPEVGKLVGIENGACAQTCHGNLTAEGDFWKVAWSSDSKSRAHSVFPVLGEDGQPAGVIYSIEDISKAADGARSTMMSTLAVIVTGLLLATLLIWFMMDGLVFKRLDRMITSMEEIAVRIAGGDFDAKFEADGSGDEIGQFEAFIAKFLGLVSGTLKSLVK